jgi:hypothetical protein
LFKFSNYESFVKARMHLYISQKQKQPIVGGIAIITVAYLPLPYIIATSPYTILEHAWVTHPCRLQSEKPLVLHHTPPFHMVACLLFHPNIDMELCAQHAIWGPLSHSTCTKNN